MPKELQIKKLKEVARSMGVDPDLIDWEAEVDEKLSYKENYERVLPLIEALSPEPTYASEYEEMLRDIERLQEENRKLRERLEKATLPEKRKYERMIEEYKKKIEELERQRDELRRLLPEELERKRREELSEIERRLEEFEESVKRATTSELLASLKLQKPPEITVEEWSKRMEIIKKELERRGVPKSPLTGEFLEPVTEWKGIPIPPEYKFYYDPVAERYYRNGKEVRPEYIERLIRGYVRPITPAPPRYRRERRIEEIPPGTVVTPTRYPELVNISILYRVDYVNLPEEVKKNPVVGMFLAMMLSEAIRTYSKYELRDLTEQEMHTVIDRAIVEFTNKAPEDIRNLVKALKQYTKSE